MAKTSDADRCQLYHRRGSRNTRCNQPGAMSYRVVDELGAVNLRRKGESYDLRICQKDYGMDPPVLDAACLATVKAHPPKDRDSLS